MVFKVFYCYDFCPLQSISCISKVVLKRNTMVLIPKYHSHLDDIKQTKKAASTPGSWEPLNLYPAATLDGTTPKKKKNCTDLAKNNLSGLAGSCFQLGSDFQHCCPDTVTTLGTSGPACNTHVMMHTYTFTSTRTHWTLCWGWDYLFFYRFLKINHTLFFLHRQVLTPNNCSHLCASKETCN